MRFSTIFFNLEQKVSLKLNMMIVCGNVYSRGKTHEKKLRGLKFWSNRPKSGPKLGFLLFSQVWFISFPLNDTG